jgi:hypothetical protein
MNDEWWIISQFLNFSINEKMGIHTKDEKFCKCKWDEKEERIEINRKVKEMVNRKGTEW